MYYVRDCMDNQTVDSFLARKSGMDTSFDKYERQIFVIDFKDIAVDFLQESAQQAYDKYGWYGFVDIFKNTFERQDVYGGLSLTYNPNYHYSDIITDPHAQTLGFPRINMPKDKFKDMKTWRKMMEERTDKSYFSDILPQLKNTYQDTYGFNQPTAAAIDGYIGQITGKIKRSLVRSRLASFNSCRVELSEKMKDRAWHRDGSWFSEMRLNISVTSSPQNHYLQLQDDSGTKLYYEPGKAYVWDTAQPHAYFAERVEDFERINLVYAISPWFDYIDEEDAWVPNKYFNKKHPIDMLMDGDIIDMDFTYEQYEY